jgi:hypothetical protein
MRSDSRRKGASAPGRRRFLQAGLAGTVLLAVLPHARVHGNSALPDGLAPGQRQVLQAVVPVMLDGALPGGSGRAPAVNAVVDGVERAVRMLPLQLQAEVDQLFSLLTSTAGRILVARVSRPWAEAGADSIASFLDRWRTSWFALLRSAYQALHELVMASWYAQPASWAALRYPGPPALR